MANVKSKQITDNMPIPSHGDGNSVKHQHFQVVLGGAYADGDTIEFGYLPHFAVPTDVALKSTGAVAAIDVGYEVDNDGLVDGLALVANVLTRSAVAAPLIGQNVGRGARKVVGVFKGAAAAGVVDLFISYLVEDPGVGAPLVSAPTS